MNQTESLFSTMQMTRANYLPIVATFCRRVGLTETINRIVPNQMEVDVGTIIQGMVLDTLSGRSPLYRLGTFFRHQDTELLFGREVPWTAFNDTTVGRAMDAVFEAGTQKVFSEVTFQASSKFPLDMHHVHFDTTSVSVWGDYDACGPHTKQLNITYGNSKDLRPDLKQFLIKMLCVNRNIPLLGGCEDGNASDKTLNNTLLTRISRHMAKHGLKPGAFLYIADCAMVTEDNLRSIGDNLFVTRLPFSYNEACRVVSEAVAEGQWEEVGVLNVTPATVKRPAARYRTTEKSVTLYDRQYRAVVVHSTAHDKRRLKRIDREIGKSKQMLLKTLADKTKHEFFCRPDAEAAASRLSEDGTDLHRIEAVVTTKFRYARGRPPKNKPKKVTSVRYVIDARVVERTEQIKRKRDESGCFVLLTNVPREGDNAEAGAELLRAYKDQHGIERNYAFMKDPLIVNDLFLKKPRRVEVLGTVLLIALLIRNLIEHVLRQYVAEHNATVPGWDNKPPTRPTTFMMSTKFIGLQFVKMGGLRWLAQPLDDVQRIYLNALSLSERALIMP